MSGELEAKPASSCALLPPNHPPRPAGPPCKPEYQPYVPPHVTWQVTSSRAKRPPTRSRPLSAPSPPVGSSDRSALGSLRTTAVPGVPGPWPPFSLVPPAPCLSSSSSDFSSDCSSRHNSFEQVNPLPSHLSHRDQGLRSISGSTVSPRGEAYAVHRLPITPGVQAGPGSRQVRRRGGAEEAPWVQPTPAPGQQPRLERQVSPPRWTWLLASESRDSTSYPVTLV